jgi:hypothetical protein
MKIIDKELWADRLFTGRGRLATYIPEIVEYLYLLLSMRDKVWNQCGVVWYAMEL